MDWGNEMLQGGSDKTVALVWELRKELCRPTEPPFSASALSKVIFSTFRLTEAQGSPAPIVWALGSSGSSCGGESPGQIQLSLKIQPCLTATQKASCGEWLSRPSGCCIPGLHGEWSSQHPSRVSVFRRTSPYSRSVFHLSSPLMPAHLRA